MPLRRPPGPPNGLTGLRHGRPLQKDFVNYIDRLAAQYGDIFHIRIGPVRIHFLSHPRQMQTVLIDRQADYRKPLRMRKAFRFLIRDGIALNDGADWQHRRKLVNAALAQLDYDRVAQAAVGQARRVFEPLANEYFDADDALERVMMGLSIETSLGDDYSHETDAIFQGVTDGVARTVALVTDPVPLWVPTPRKRRIGETARWMAGLAEEARRRCMDDQEDPSRCLMAGLVRAHDAEGRAGDPREVVEEALMMIIGGKETAGPSATWMGYLLAKHPEFQQRCAEQVREVLGDRPMAAADVGRLTLLEAAFKESNRLYPPAVVILREVDKPTQIDGYDLSPGDSVCLYCYGMHRDGRWFDEPNEFRPERFLARHGHDPSAYLPFGMGKRACPGGRISVVGALGLFATILQRWRLELPPGVPPAEPCLHMGLRPKHGLRLRLTPADSAATSAEEFSIHEVQA